MAFCSHKSIWTKCLQPNRKENVLKFEQKIIGIILPYDHFVAI